MGKPLLGALALGTIAACALPQPAANESPPTAGHACPHRIVEAAAWVNHMPSVGRAPRNLVVDVRLEEASDTAVLVKSTASTREALVLEIRPAQTVPVPGRLAYREPAPEPIYERISFVCRGAEIRSLDHIEKVY